MSTRQADSKRRRKEPVGQASAEIPVKKPKLDDKNRSNALLDLPDDILVMITEKLRFKEVVKLRRVCRRLRDLFPAFCKAPVVKYNTNTLAAKKAKVRGISRLQKIVKSVTFSNTVSLTIVQPSDSRFVINPAIVDDLKKRCAAFKRLILKGPFQRHNFPPYRRSKIKEGVIQKIPASWELELHNAQLVDDGIGIIRTNVHGIFRGPFDEWRVEYVAEHEEDEEFGEYLKGRVWSNSFDADEVDYYDDGGHFDIDDIDMSDSGQSEDEEDDEENEDE